MEALVSIITPCYNGEKYVRRFLDSILDQTYRAIELIFINDGSTDCTEEIVLSYIPIFQKQNIELIYEWQPNMGQAAALNRGLKLFKGQYLTWPDSDDFLDRTSIEKRIIFLEENLQYGFVRSNAYFVNFQTLKPIKRVSVLSRRFASFLFDGFIRGTQFWLNGCYLVRSSAFLDVNPERTIEASFVGQNVQMLLPISYKFLCGYIDECLFYYVNTPNSHSRVKRTYQEAKDRCDEFYRLLYSTCQKIEMEKEDRCKYERLINQCFLSACKSLAINYKQVDDFKKYELLYRTEYLGRKKYFLSISFMYYWVLLVDACISGGKRLIKYFIK